MKAGICKKNGRRVCMTLLASLAGLVPPLILSTDGAQEEKPAAPFLYDDHGKRDPFWQLVSPTGAIINYEKDLVITDMVLEGIITGKGGENIAIINGIIVKAQDRIGSYVIKKVQEQSVTLQRGHEEFILKLKKEE